jgi:ribosomal-protein-serine acetyltransferase
MLVQIKSLQSACGISIIPVAVEHAPALALLVQQNVEHLRTFLPGVTNLSSVEAAKNHLWLAVERAAKTEVFEWHLFLGGTLCGAVRLKDIDENDRKAKFGYFIGQQFTGKGLVTSAVRSVLEYCFGHLNLNRIELRCAAENERSKRVAERLGFVREGILREEEFLDGAFVDLHVYGLLGRDFKSDGRFL